jgi:hypothetical protein
LFLAKAASIPPFQRKEKTIKDEMRVAEGDVTAALWDRSFGCCVFRENG